MIGLIFRGVAWGRLKGGKGLERGTRVVIALVGKESSWDFCSSVYKPASLTCSTTSSKLSFSSSCFSSTDPSVSSS